MTVWFTSDQHHGHRRICELSARPWPDAAAMGEALIANHNARVAPTDTVWHLGDFSLDADVMAAVLPRLNGEHHLVSGNHDRCHPSHKAGAKETRAYLAAGFRTVVERCVLGDSHLGRVLMCHLPLLGSGDHGPEERYAAWRPTDALTLEAGCSSLLHGHVHTDYAERLVGGVPCINVGVDVRGFAPVSAAELRGVLAGMGGP